jgi:predicted NAD/FAD-dependent oxidoreductase
MRNDARPGREPTVGETHWVAHARAAWSRQHLEQPADWVQRQMQSALQDGLGEPIRWEHAVVHRWRYAAPQPSAAAGGRPCWWDGTRGLGVCGDFLGGTGVEGAWRSAQALVEALLRDAARWSTPPEASRIAPGMPLPEPQRSPITPARLAQGGPP